MQLIGIPQDTSTHIHRASCRDIGSADYHGLTYDDCQHIEAVTKTEVAAQIDGPLNYFPCTRKLRKI